MTTVARKGQILTVKDACLLLLTITGSFLLCIDALVCWVCISLLEKENQWICVATQTLQSVDAHLAPEGGWCVAPPPGHCGHGSCRPPGPPAWWPAPSDCRHSPVQTVYVLNIAYTKWLKISVVTSWFSMSLICIEFLAVWTVERPAGWIAAVIQGLGSGVAGGPDTKHVTII